MTHTEFKNSELAQNKKYYRSGLKIVGMAIVLLIANVYLFAKVI